MNDMTTKQIAELANVGARTVRLWTAKVAVKITAMAVKITASTSMHPATFTLDETLAIIRAGGNNTLADLLAQNAGMVERVKMLEGVARKLSAGAPRLLGVDKPLSPPPPPPAKGEYMIGSFPDGVERLTLCPFWPCRYGVLARYLGIRPGLAYEWARKLDVDPESISSEQAMKIWRAMTGTPEEKK